MIVAIIIGFLIGVQVVNDAKNFTFINISTVGNLSSDLENIERDIEDLKNLIVKSKNEAAQYDMLQMNGQDISGFLESEIYRIKAVAGYTNVRGEGILLKLTDNLVNTQGNINFDLVHDIDVSIIINDLISSGAEAVSINGKRVLSNTEVVCIGPLIRINGEGVAAPFIIKAIGNKDALSAAINAPNTYAYKLKEMYGIGLETMKSKFILIPKFNEN